jgi:NADH-quinone oxidoreductase subunit J
MSADAVLFWILSIVCVASALTVILIANPIYSALALAMTMVGISALFVTLGAFFIAGVQLIVYAGAVMVLFVMVLMLFDLKNEIFAFSRGKFSGAIKISAVGMLAGLMVGAILATYGQSDVDLSLASFVGGDSSKNIGRQIFTQYILAFEIIGILLTVVAIGSVALSRSKGGTHGKS